MNIKEMDRRQFLKRIAGLGAGVATAAVVVPTVLDTERIARAEALNTGECGLVISEASDIAETAIVNPEDSVAVSLSDTFNGVIEEYDNTAKEPFHKFWGYSVGRDDVIDVIADGGRGLRAWEIVDQERNDIPHSVVTALYAGAGYFVDHASEGIAVTGPNGYNYQMAEYAVPEQGTTGSVNPEDGVNVVITQGENEEPVYAVMEQWHGAIHEFTVEEIAGDRKLVVYGHEDGDLGSRAYIAANQDTALEEALRVAESFKKANPDAQVWGPSCQDVEVPSMDMFLPYISKNGQ